MLAEYRREIRCSSEDLSDAEIRAVQISFLVLNEKRHRASRGRRCRAAFKNIPMQDMKSALNHRDRTTHIIIDLTPRTTQLSRRFILIRQSTPKIVFHVKIRRVRIVCISNNLPCLLNNYNVLHAEL